MKKILQHLRTYAVRGLFAIIPLALSFLAIRFLYVAIDQRVMKLVYQFVGFKIPGLGIVLLLLSLYLLGLIASNVIGRQVFGLLEKLSNKIPFIKTIYQIGQQLVTTFSLPGKQIFKRVVLVDYLKPGIWTIGFVTGSVVDRQNGSEILLKVFIPTPPNPTSGTMVIVREDQTRDPGWTIDQAMKAVLSGGIIGPDAIDIVEAKRT